jgi:hypothetical protein
MILYNTTGMSHGKVQFSRNYLQTVRHWRAPQTVTFNFHENVLQTARHWRTPQAATFNLHENLP